MCSRSERHKTEAQGTESGTERGTERRARRGFKRKGCFCCASNSILCAASCCYAKLNRHLLSGPTGLSAFMSVWRLPTELRTSRASRATRSTPRAALSNTSREKSTAWTPTSSNVGRCAQTAQRCATRDPRKWSLRRRWGANKIWENPQRYSTQTKRCARSPRCCLFRGRGHGPRHHPLLSSGAISDAVSAAKALVIRLLFDPWRLNYSAGV